MLYGIVVVLGAARLVEAVFGIVDAIESGGRKK